MELFQTAVIFNRLNYGIFDRSAVDCLGAWHCMLSACNYYDNSRNRENAHMGRPRGRLSVACVHYIHAVGSAAVFNRDYRSVHRKNVYGKQKPTYLYS